MKLFSKRKKNLFIRMNPKLLRDLNKMKRPFKTRGNHTKESYAEVIRRLLKNR